MERHQEPGFDPAYLAAFSEQERREALALAVEQGITPEQAFEHVARESLERALGPLPGLAGDSFSVHVRWLEGPRGLRPGLVVIPTAHEAL